MPVQLNLFIESFANALQKLLNLESYKKMFLLVLLQTIAFVIFAVLFFALFFAAGIIFFGPAILSGDSEKITEIFTNPNLFAATVFFLLALISLICFFVLSVLFSTAGLAIAKSILNKKLIGVKDAVNQAKSGLRNTLPASLLLSLISLAILAITILPLMAVWFILFPSFDPNNAIGWLAAFGFFFVGVILAFLIILFLSPITSIVVASSFFEERGAFDSLRISITRAKKYYIEMLVYLFLIGLITGTIGTIQWFFDQFLGIIDQVISYGLMSSFFLPTLIVAIPWIIIRVAISVAFMAAITLIGAVLSVNLYMIVAGKTGSSKNKK